MYQEFTYDSQLKAEVKALLVVNNYSQLRPRGASVSLAVQDVPRAARPAPGTGISGAGRLAETQKGPLPAGLGQQRPADS